MKPKSIVETFMTSALLAFSGGLQDAYTYNSRAHVFSNAQTGNIVLLAQNFMEGNIQKALTYLLPISAFLLGVLIAEQLQGKYHPAKRWHWYEMVLLIMIGTLFSVGFMPESWNNIATMFVSFSCAIQVQAFQKIHGNQYASTMCIGNIKSGTAAFSTYLRTRNPEKLTVTFHYLGIILIFALGAGFGGILSIHYGYRVIWLSCLILTILLFRIHPHKKDL